MTVTESPESPTSRTGRSPVFVALIGAFGLMVGYLLSPLPIMCLVVTSGTDGDGMFWRAMIALLAPIEWLYENVPLATRFYDWYLHSLT